MKNEKCNFGSFYGTCCTTDKNGNPMDTTRIRNAFYEEKVDGDTFNVCKGCVANFAFNAKNRDSVTSFDSDGNDATIEFSDKF